VHLPCAQARESIVVQRFFLVIIPVSTTMDLKGGAVVMSRHFRHSQEMFISACGYVHNFSGCRPAGRAIRNWGKFDE
jgi:hypothetical protein